MMSIAGGAPIAIKELAGCAVTRFGALPQDCEVLLSDVPTPAMEVWMAAPSKGTDPLRTVVFSKIDQNANVLGTLTLSSAFIHRVTLSDLDATAAKNPALLTVRITADAIATGGAGGTVTLPTGTPRPPTVATFRLAAGTAALPSAIRLDHLAFEYAIVTTGKTRRPGAPSVDVSTLEFSASDTQIRPWVADTVAGLPARDLKVDLLDGTGNSTLMTWTVRDAVPLGPVQPFALGTIQTTGAGFNTLELQGGHVTVAVP